ncbi:hypothetical protein TNCV_1567351 [Trichonephila clavipes]|nr:hypothetical protein TNCV_1567351 [Trichonephila clavipes]
MLLGKVTSVSPRQIRQLDFISQFTHKYCTHSGSDNGLLLGILSRVSAITFPGSQIDYDSIAGTQQTIRASHLIASGIPWNSKVTFPNSSTEIVAAIYQQARKPDPTSQNSIAKMFSLLVHNLSHPGIRRSVHLMKRRFCLAINLIRCS